MKQCHQCGSAVRDEAEVCEFCGTQLSNQETPSAEEKIQTYGELPHVPILPHKKANRTKKRLLVAGIALFLILCTCGAWILIRTPSVKDIVLTKSTLQLNVGEGERIHYVIHPEKASKVKVTWTSSAPWTAEVNENGYIQAVSSGNCIVTIKAGKVEKSVSVEVSDVPDLSRCYSLYCSSRWAEVGSDNSWLTVDTNPSDKDDYIEYSASSAIPEINEYLGLPESLYIKMGETRALDGRQSEKYEYFTVSWTYHPDRGLEILYERNQNQKG